MQQDFLKYRCILFLVKVFLKYLIENFSISNLNQDISKIVHSFIINTKNATHSINKIKIPYCLFIGAQKYLFGVSIYILITSIYGTVVLIEKLLAWFSSF